MPSSLICEDLVSVRYRTSRILCLSLRTEYSDGMFLLVNASTRNDRLEKVDEIACSNLSETRLDTLISRSLHYQLTCVSAAVLRVPPQVNHSIPSHAHKLFISVKVTTDVVVPLRHTLPPKLEENARPAS